MKRIIFSDLHLHTFSYGATVTSEGFNSRLYAQYEALMEMAEYAERNDIKYVYFTGDLFHTPGRIPTQALQLAHIAFFEMRRKGLHLRFLVGNHDIANRAGTTHALSWLEQYGMVIDGTAPQQWVDNDLDVFALGYTENEELITRTLKCAGDGSIVLLHQGVTGHALGSGYVMNDILTAGMIRPELYHVFTGHYHRTDFVTKNLTIVGAMTPLTWSDMNEDHGFLVWDDAINKVTQCVSEIPPKFVSITVDELGVGTHDFTNSFVRVIGKPALNLEEIRNDMMECGALRVEFHVDQADENKATLRQAFKTFDISLGIENAEKNINPERKVVGEKLRAFDYVAPEKLGEFN